MPVHLRRVVKQTCMWYQSLAYKQALQSKRGERGLRCGREKDSIAERLLVRRCFLRPSLFYSRCRHSGGKGEGGGVGAAERCFRRSILRIQIMIGIFNGHQNPMLLKHSVAILNVLSSLQGYRTQTRNVQGSL